MSATKTWRVLGIELAVGEPEELVRERACRLAGVDPARLRGFRLVKKALDARRRFGERRLGFLVHADLVTDAHFQSGKLKRATESGQVAEAPAMVRPVVDRPHVSVLGSNPARVAVVGAGPGGLFAAHVLALHGARVVVIDRGEAVEQRSRSVVRFHRSRVPDPESNLLFGEGGAGTFSDGKLYTRVDDPLEVPLLEELVACGAPAGILYDARAHIGTDKLHRLLPVLRARLAARGVEFHWSTRVEGLAVGEGATGRDRRVRALRSNRGDITCDAVVLAPGHSARDTWRALEQIGVAVEAKPFQIGVRIEHPQELITRAQFGDGPDARALGAASYQLACRAGDGWPSAHSFCMCAGGRIVASVNEPGYLCTNGMSNSAHSSRWANAALVATIGPREYGVGAYAGVEFQRQLEGRFFEAGGSEYAAPAQRAPDFLAGRETAGALATSYRLGAVPGRIDLLLPELLRETLRRALTHFDRIVPGFAGPEGLLVGIESRSSGPVRLPRDPTTRRALGFSNLYPVGEGAGYAGGITSAALDGMHAALALLELGVPR